MTKVEVLWNHDVTEVVDDGIKILSKKEVVVRRLESEKMEDDG